jgi:hypothetical protein
MLRYAADGMQARQDGTLDDRVVSLQSRRELLNTLDLIPPQYTYEAACAALQDAPQGSTKPAVPALLSAQGTERQLLDLSQHKGRTQQGPCLPLQVLLLIDECLRLHCAADCSLWAGAQVVPHSS